VPSGLDFQIWDNSTLDRPDRGPQSVSCSAGPEKAEFSGLKIEALDPWGDCRFRHVENCDCYFFGASGNLKPT
jgi:hypothetical protein